MPRISKGNALVVYQGAGRKKGKKGKRVKGSGPNSSSVSGNSVPKMLMQAYYKSLINPFENQGCYLGWGCMVPSTIASAYLRGVVTSFTDGTISFMVVPTCGSASIYYNNTGSTTTTWTGLAFANNAPIGTNFSEGRPISVGIRAFPAQALTSNQSAVYTGATVPTFINNLIGLAPVDLQTLPTTHMSIGVSGGSSTGRPIDPDSFTFNTYTITGVTGGALSSQNLNFSVPYISFAGLPASTNVFFEAVFNFEATAIVARNVQTVVPAGSVSMPTLSDYFVNYESMHKPVANILPPPGRAGEQSAASDTSFLENIWELGKSGLRTLAGAFGGGLGRGLANMILPPAHNRPLVTYGGSGMGLPPGISGYLQN